MKPGKEGKISPWIVIGICITTYIFFFYNLVAVYLSLIGSQAANPLVA